MNWNVLSRVLLLLVAIGISSLSKADTTWIDVRSSIEHSIDKIDGDVRISHGDIVQEVSKMFPDKGTEIRLYCLSGGRAGKAMSALQAAGYTQVSNAGGIGDARNERGLNE